MKLTSMKNLKTKFDQFQVFDKTDHLASQAPDATMAFSLMAHAVSSTCLLFLRELWHASWPHCIHPCYTPLSTQSAAPSTVGLLAHSTTQAVYQASCSNGPVGSPLLEDYCTLSPRPAGSGCAAPLR